MTLQELVEKFEAYRIKHKLSELTSIEIFADGSGIMSYPIWFCDEDIRVFSFNTIKELEDELSTE